MIRNSIKVFFAVTLILSLIILLFPGRGNRGMIRAQKDTDKNKRNYIMGDKVKKTDSEWKEILNDQEYMVLRKKGTERAFTGEYNQFKESGIFICAGCGNELFSSETKYDSGSGWPSFWAPLSDKNIELEKDDSVFMSRTEVVCARCGGHLGHVFNDGPAPTHQRFCINSVSLDFEKNQTKKDSLKK